MKADFDSRMERTPENVKKYASLHRRLPEGRKAPPLRPERRGQGRRVRLPAGRSPGEADRRKFSDISDLMREAHYWAKKDGANFVRGEHVKQAIEEKVFRVNRIEETAAGGDPGRHADHQHGRGEGRPGERPRRSRPGRLQLRQALPHHRQDLYGQGRHRQYRAGDKDERQDP